MVDGSDAANLQACGSVYRASPGARFAAGIAAGMVGGILMMGFMMAYSSVTGAGVTMPLKALGALVYGVGRGLDGDAGWRRPSFNARHGNCLASVIVAITKSH